MISPVKIWRNQKQVQKLVNATGRVTTWTVIRVPPSGYGDQAPYAVVLVKLDRGESVMCQMVDTDFETINAGTPVKLVVRRIREPDADGIISYGIKAKQIYAPR